MARRNTGIVMLIVASTAWSPALGVTIHRVDGSLTGPGPQDGTSWATAFRSLNSALNRTAAYDEIWVARGTYRPGTISTDTFELREGGSPERHNDNILIFGGFLGVNHPTLPGGETLRTQRDFVKNVTVLSGDIVGTTNDVQTVLKILVPYAEVNGFTITGGVGTNGAGLKIEHMSNPTLVNCRFVDNGVVAENENQEHDTQGGAISFQGVSQAVIEDCVFEGNRAGAGAAIWLPGFSSEIGRPTIRRCRFVNNYAARWGAAIDNRYQSEIIVQDCFFENNRADVGFQATEDHHRGGGAFYSINGRAKLINCVFFGNRSAQNGGAVSIEGGGVQLTMINCTFSGNTAGWIGGGFYQHEGDSILTNCVFWDNSDFDGTSNAQSQIRINDQSQNLTYSVTYSCIMDDTPGDGNIPYGAGSGNIDDEPLFLNSFRGNLHLQQDSPCIDAGNNAAVTVADDIDGRPRKIPTVVDMGAHEFDSQFTDCDSNGILDDIEISESGSLDCNGNGILDRCEVPEPGTGLDCNGNGVPDSCDIFGTELGTSFDCNANGIPDECEFAYDCNHNCVEDEVEIGSGAAQDCNGNLIPDECELVGPARWTKGDDFREGTLINMLIDPAVPGEEELTLLKPDETSCLPYVWVPCTDRNTAVLIRSDATQSANAVVGEYRTGPYHHRKDDGGMNSSISTGPRRMVVDLDGSAWIGNAGESGSGTFVLGGSATKIGIVVGGTRVDDTGVADPNGEYLKPPFDYCTCEDRDNDGLIRTSRGLGDILEWNNFDGTDDSGARYIPDDTGPTGTRRTGTENAADECILRYTRLTSPGTRTVALDKENNVWAGGWDNNPRIERWHEKIAGDTGIQFPSDQPNTRFLYPTPWGHGGYSGLIDGLDYLWSSSWTTLAIRVDTHNVTDAMSVAGSGGTGGITYGVALDRDGTVWVGNGTSNQVTKIAKNQNGFEIGSFGVGLNQQGQPNRYVRGVAVTPQDNHVWTANSDSDNVTRLDNSGAVQQVIELGTDGDDPRGIAVDSLGKVWVTCYQSHTAKRIDPATGLVDLTIDLDLPNNSPYPYNTTGMTGVQSHLATGVGAWSVVHDSGRIGQDWATVVWNTESPCAEAGPDSRIVVDVRAAPHEAALNSYPYKTVPVSGYPMVDADAVVGRFVQVRVRFEGYRPGTSPTAAPVLCDLRVVPANCEKGDVNGDGQYDAADLNLLTSFLNTGNSCYPQICAADLNANGVIDLDDADCLMALVLGGSGCVVPELVQIVDCNTNGVPDADDIALATSADVNINGIPDECEPDCNRNGTPDDYDVLIGLSYDCNQSGYPDECEDDCNTNGIADSCDIDPLDPDGNFLVSRDCNGNEVPDECDLAMPPPWGSLDCNENGVPDECDIMSCSGDPACDDCNGNGFPDGCDIAAGISDDWDTNGVPDECEGQQMMAMMGGGGGPPDPGEWEADRWIVFYDWAILQCWGPNCEVGMYEQFVAMIDKLRELELPVKSFGP